MATSTSGINNYTYNYNNKVQPKLDKNDDAVWDKTELTNYATAYKKATGTTLDVDKLMEKYANKDGVIDYENQQKIQKDDALGLNKLTNTSASTAATSASSTSAATSAASKSSTMTQQKKFDIYDAVNSFSYEYNNKLEPLLDKNDDGMWNREELTNYATAFNKATGEKLDVDALITKYGNEDGAIDPKNQAKIRDNDALKLSTLKTSYDTARATATTAAVTNKEPTKYTAGKNTSDYSVEDLLGSMSSSGKMFFATNINKLDNVSAMLSNFDSSFGSSSSDMFNLISSTNSLNMYKSMASSGNAQSLYSAMSGQLMNFTL